MKGQATKCRKAAEAVGVVVMALLGAWVVYAVGPHDGADPNLMKMGMGVGTAYFLAMILWVARRR